MAIITSSSSQSLVFLNPNKPLLSFQHRLNKSNSSLPVETTTVIFSPPIPRHIPPLRINRRQKLTATSIPVQTSTLFTSSPKEIFSTILALAAAVSKQVVSKLSSLSLHGFQIPLVELAGAAGKWVELYHSILTVRILLSWFPNWPWEEQPFSAMRDVTDPYLSFFRAILPPFRGVDISVLLATMFLSVLSGLLTNSSPPVIN